MNRICFMKKKYFNCIIALVFLLSVFPFFSFAQLDTVHWIPPLHSRDNAQVNDHYVYLSTPKTNSFVVTIKDGAGNILATPSIDNANPFKYTVGNGQTSGSPVFVPIDSLNKVLTRSGLLFTANEVFYANLRVQSGSQADCLTAKGTAALGTTFRVGGFPQVLDAGTRDFTAGIMARDSNTTVTISGYNSGVLFAGVPYVSTPSITVILNQGECYVISGYTNTAANLSGFIGALVQADKPIILNNGNMLGTIANNGSQDIGIDQSVPIEKVGKNYILIEGNGNSDMEEPIVIAHYNNTGIFINGNAVPIATINAGQYYLVPNSNYQGSPHRNMHIHTSEPAYMYQALAGSTSYATGGLNFIPPYNCYLQDTIDQIPFVDKIGATSYTGGVMVFTKQGATLKINGVTQTGAVPVLSAPWVTYKILGLTGNIKITSTSGVAAGIFGASGAAGYAGYFSGFSDVPMPTTYSYATYTDTCVSFPIDFVAYYDGAIDSLMWDFGDPGSGSNDTSSLQNITHTFSAAGNYDVKLIVFRCENDTVIHKIRAFSIPIAGFSTADVCYKDSVYFTNTSIVDTSSLNDVYQWNFGDGSPTSNLKNPAHYYSNPGTYTVTLIVTCGCSDTATAVVNVFDAPVSAFTFSNNCSADSILFTNTSQNPTMGSTASWSWDFGNGSPSITQTPPLAGLGVLYAASGNYQVTIITYSSNLGCSDTLKDTVTVFPMPIANFGFTDVCLNTSMSFYDMSFIASGSIASWSWDFGDGTPMGTTQLPIHNYANPGTYTVSLMVTTNNGCKDTVVKTVIVHPLPDAQYSTANVCDGASVQFLDSSIISTPDMIQTWDWNFGDGTPVYNNQNASHPYSAAGSYTVQLLVISDFGCSDSITKTVLVHPNPVANFNNTSVCHTNATQFTDSSTTTFGSISNWSWDFGDGSPLNNTQSPSFLYANAGIYNVTLIVDNSFGCGDTITKPVQVYFNPIADFTNSNVCFGDSMYFINASSVDTSTSIAGYLWVFGDNGPTNSLQNPSHYYSGAGTFTVTLITTTTDGCSNANSAIVKAFDSPTSAFIFSNTCLVDSAVFTNTSVNPIMGSIASWSWDFGDGSPLLTQTPPLAGLGVLYASPGNYQVTLITYSSNLGCSDTLKDSITVFPVPVANFSFSDVCLNQAINFNDSSTVSNGSIVSWSWDFGDGSPIVTLQNPIYTYSTPGTYIVSLIVATNNSCIDSITKSVVAHPLPIAQYSASNVCDGSSIQFNDLSNILPTDTIQFWTWNFGDGTPSDSSQNTSHLYATAGSDTVHLVVVSNFGCMDSISKISIINPNPVVNFMTQDTIGCEPLCVSFQNLSTIATGFNASSIWNFGDGSPTSNSLIPVHCYSNDSVYSPNYFNVTLTVTSDSGCITMKSKNNYITVYPNPNAYFTVQPQTTTITDPVISITNLTTGGNFWNWNFGDADTSSVFNPSSHTYPDTGIYIITLITSTQYDCADTMYQTIVIEPDFLFYIPNAFTPNDDGVNDTFYGKGIFITDYEMSIFDRWGNLIFYSDDINKQWDGKANHGTEIAQEDVYIYSFKVTDFKKGKHNYKGIVTLLR